MIKLHQFPPAYGLPSASPFCMKVENYLRMTDIPFQSAHSLDPRQAPKGKLPFIEDGGQVIADSELIIKYLKATYGDPLDAHLSAAERAVSVAFMRLLDEHLYWAGMIQPRWVEQAGWDVIRPVFFGGLGGLLRFVVPPVARRNIVKQMRGHGMGRHSPEEIGALACADIAALADYLGDKPYFLGERPTTLDAAAYAHLASLLAVPIESPAKRCAEGFPNLVAYCQRMKQAYYAERVA